MSPKIWIFALVSHERHWFQICSQHPRMFIFVRGWVNTVIWCAVVLRAKKKRKKSRSNVWMANGLSAWVIMILNQPRPKWLELFFKEDKHYSFQTLSSFVSAPWGLQPLNLHFPSLFYSFPTLWWNSLVQLKLYTLNLFEMENYTVVRVTVAE